ncbi:hypothetical protein E8E15_001120 [Penicillium rubens]|jgi:hypothetical protein|uniref:ceramidase n=2 Tax=Penicillium chrysogenum species complex TaxID=254878 RepID=B6HLC3_PENRW|nr:uncharacterized protein N7525_008176 [Penicillium rubens]KZN89238.1 Acid ceramidase [Penicillium chrysogenum]CAP96544.1 Pc21g16470 [Penicillium rubens Wisconsin 54-1255]KAF3014834.1 hypothetical protein E8E15_001120 [Penicillium rubens]KAJ5048654.1 hypothetical protein NUH16_007162 [Penicillium rubens]KAJ5829923.1 hypothetical protein N7525_008176 [Penicillium rubens]
MTIRLKELSSQQPPIFRINLSHPPEERYTALAHLYKDRMRSVTSIFDDVIHNLSPKIPTKPIHWLARLFLRRLYTDEETAEIHGISRVTGIDLYLLISLNVVLDLLMGCTSGGVRMLDGLWTRMVHFRTLDWGMDPLRSLIVQLEFVRDDEPDTVLATCITYVGFVGILTGVRKDLSVSLNFRAVHDTRRDVGFYFNYLLVLLGLRQSITSLLRQFVLPMQGGSTRLSNTSTLEEILHEVPFLRTTAAYLIFCDGRSIVAMEKDYGTAFWRRSSSFLIKTNHDEDTTSVMDEAIANDRGYTGLRVADGMQSMAEIIEESKARQASMQGKWDRRVRDHGVFQQQLKRRRVKDDTLPRSMHLKWKRNTKMGWEDPESEVSVTLGTVLGWLCSDPIVNEDTHYAVLMDPVEGRFIYSGQFPAKVA